MISFRGFLESPSFCGLELSPLVAAIADASEGARPAIDDETSLRHFGCTVDELPTEARRVVAVRAGGRAGKTSRLLAPKMVHAAWTAPVPNAARGELAMSLGVAPDMGLGRQIISFARGYAEGSPILRRALVDEPTADGFTLRRPDGVLVRVEIRAASRGGRSLRGRTLVFAGLDEACFFFDESTGVVNDMELFRAVLQRVVPDGQVWVVSTPWAEGVGLLEDLVEKNLGTHGHALAVVAPTRAMNPSWDPDGSIERHLRELDPDAAAREIDAIPTAGGGGSYFDAGAIDRAVDPALPLAIARPAQRGVISSVVDIGLRSDSSAVAVVYRIGDGFALLALDEMRPAKGAPLKPSEVISTFASTLAPYGVRRVGADQFYVEAVREELAKHSLSLVELPNGQTGKIEQYATARRIFNEGRFVMPKHPRLIAQLKAIRSKPTAGGGLQITAPRRSGHGDLVSALVGALWLAEQAGAPRTGDPIKSFTGGERTTAHVDVWSGGGSFAGSGKWATGKGW